MFWEKNTVSQTNCKQKESKKNPKKWADADGENGPYQQYFLVFLVAHNLPCHLVDCTEIPS